MAANSENNESFDALIDLLASDNVPDDPRFNKHSSTGLRDDEGNLDLGKIHSFFAAGREGDHTNTGNDPRLSGARPDKDPFSLSFEVNEEPTVTLPRSIPSSLDPLNFQASTVATKNSSTEAARLLSLDSTYHNVVTPIHGFNDSQEISQERVLKQNQTPVDTTINTGRQTGGMTIGMEPLDEALKLANEEVRQLRQQCDELLARAQVSDKNVLQASKTSSIPTEIATLTEWEAKERLSSVLRALSLPVSSVLEDIVPLAALAHSPNTILEVQRALAFTTETDELVWRRLKYNLSPGAGPSSAVFDPQNISALRQRLSLWERVVRQAP